MAGIALTMHAAVAAPFVPNETFVSSQADLIDFEFSQSNGQIVWGDEFGNLWIANVDRSTGSFMPANGKGILVDPSAATFADGLKTFNGPEWVSTSEGDHVVYTKYKGRHIDGNGRLGYGRQTPDGQWFGDFLGPDVPRKGPFASATPGDPAARLTYVDNVGNRYWRELWRPETERLIASPIPSNTPLRHARGLPAITYRLPVNGVLQAVIHHFDTDAIEQLTFDDGDKSEVWMWRAPEFANELIFMTLVNGVNLRVYRKLPVGAGGELEWTTIYTAQASASSVIMSPEPFTFAGRSYIVMAMKTAPANYVSAIWVSNIDSEDPIFRRITDNSVLRGRTDPEVFITDRGPRIYYNRLVPKSPRSGCIKIQCSEGVYMADPGLDP